MTPLIIGLIQAETQTKTTGVDLKPEGIVIPTPNFTIVTIILGIQETQNPVTVTRSTREVFISRACGTPWIFASCTKGTTTFLCCRTTL